LAFIPLTEKLESLGKTERFVPQCKAEHLDSTILEKILRCIICTYVAAKGTPATWAPIQNKSRVHGSLSEA